MPSVADLVEDAELRRLADAETYTRGVELAARVRMSAFGPLRVAGTVEGGEAPAAVELSVSDGILAWSCSDGDASPALICAHTIALAVEARRRAPNRRD